MEKMKPIKQQKLSPPTVLGLYKIFWMFFIACVVGYVFETIQCLVLHGYIESRQGMLYGPFSQVYGFGGVFMLLVLHRLEGKNIGWVFLVSALVGGTFEVICSMIQENIFSSVSWNYTYQSFHFFSGRTSLIAMATWGVLGVALMKAIYPHLLLFVESIPKKQGAVFAWILAAFLAFDMSLSAAAILRWSERVYNLAPTNQLELYLDKHYPDDYMKSIYPNMRFDLVSKN